MKKDYVHSDPSSASPAPRRHTGAWLVTMALAAGGLSLIAVYAWTSKATGLPVAAVDGPAAPTLVELTTVSLGKVTDMVRAVGTLEANESVMIRPEIAGVVTNVMFTEGQPVERGTVLLELDDSEVQAHLAEAAAQLKIARVTYDRMKQLIGNQNPFISPQQIDESVTNLHAAEANYSLYQTKLSKTRIRAPFSGYLGIRRISPGDYVHPGQDLVNLEDLRTLKIDFKVPETYLSRLSVGQRVEVSTDADPKARIVGRIYVIDPRVDAASRAVRIRAMIANAGDTLRPGLFANVHLVLGEQDHAVLVPEESVIPQREKTFVYRVEDGVAHWREVQTGSREGGLVQILSGLHEGESIVRVGHHKLKDGARVAAVSHASQAPH